ncbi:hypothetical protein BDA99DRAFT_540002 [Phascolomyces articulosus]|uniref:Uncharacterized protein n=1 Tax=Phascolomyces articulosus TaxID=60185 RepID=A0AAD5K4D8_9FUNG|nr:hypothetical protein BDA99DRAFT_540002 [Phascolomyces articulosus]
MCCRKTTRRGVKPRRARSSSYQISTEVLRDIVDKHITASVQEYYSKNILSGFISIDELRRKREKMKPRLPERFWNDFAQDMHANYGEPLFDRAGTYTRVSNKFKGVKFGEEWEQELDRLLELTPTQVYIDDDTPLYFIDEHDMYLLELTTDLKDQQLVSLLDDGDNEDLQIGDNGSDNGDGSDYEDIDVNDEYFLELSNVRVASIYKNKDIKKMSLSIIVPEEFLQDKDETFQV